MFYAYPRIFNCTKLSNVHRAFVVTSTGNNQIIHLFKIIEILNKFKIFQNHRIEDILQS